MKERLIIKEKRTVSIELLKFFYIKFNISLDFSANLNDQNLNKNLKNFPHILLKFHNRVRIFFGGGNKYRLSFLIEWIITESKKTDLLN